MTFLNNKTHFSNSKRYLRKTKVHNLSFDLNLCESNKLVWNLQLERNIIVYWSLFSVFCLCPSMKDESLIMTYSYLSLCIQKTTHQINEKEKNKHIKSSVNFHMWFLPRPTNMMDVLIYFLYKHWKTDKLY